MKEFPIYACCHFIGVHGLYEAAMGGGASGIGTALCMQSTPEGAAADDGTKVSTRQGPQQQAIQYSWDNGRADNLVFPPSRFAS